MTSRAASPTTTAGASKTGSRGAAFLGVPPMRVESFRLSERPKNAPEFKLAERADAEEIARSYRIIVNAKAPVGGARSILCRAGPACCLQRKRENRRIFALMF